MDRASYWILKLCLWRLEFKIPSDVSWVRHKSLGAGSDWVASN